MRSAVRRSFNGITSGRVSHITEGHKAVFMAMTSGEPDFCLTSTYLNGRPGVAIVLVGPGKPGEIEMAPCFVSITPGMKLRMMDGHEFDWREGGSAPIAREGLPPASSRPTRLRIAARRPLKIGRAKWVRTFRHFFACPPAPG